MRGLPVELICLLLITLCSAEARPSTSRDAHLPCGGNLSALNVDGESPWVVYDELQQPCLTSVGAVPPQSCRWYVNIIPISESIPTTISNLAVYNVYMASKTCQQEEVQPWSQWSTQNLCNTSQPPTTIPYSIENIVMPKWAYQNLTNGQFDVNTAVQQESGWSPIQIALPIIVGVVVALVAGILFIWYRSRHEGAFRNRSRSQKAWQSANLHAPRRLFGLLPERFVVRERTFRGPQWEIDENVVLGDDEDPAKMSDGRSSRASGHSRVTSSSALIDPDSRQSSRSRPLFDTLTSKLSNISLGKKYQNGTSKGSDYRRVKVIHNPPDARFGIDGELPTPSGQLYDEHTAPFKQDSVETQPSLPSVLDIRAPSVAAGSDRARYRNDSLPTTDDARTDFAPPTVMQSDFSLGSNDLVTPISPSSGSSHPQSSVNHRASVVSPNSPLLPANRFEVMPTIRASPSPYINRRESTDSQAHELYPRGPSYEC